MYFLYITRETRSVTQRCNAYYRNIKEYNKTFDSDFDNEYKIELNKKSQFLERNGDNLKIKEEYLYVQNDIILAFMKG